MRPRARVASCPTCGVLEWVCTWESHCVGVLVRWMRPCPGLRGEVRSAGSRRLKSENSVTLFMNGLSLCAVRGAYPERSNPSPLPRSLHGGRPVGLCGLRLCLPDPCQRGCQASPLHRHLRGPFFDVPILFHAAFMTQIFRGKIGSPPNCATETA